MTCRVLRIVVVWITFLLLNTSVALAIESLTNHAMDGITGQAVVEQSNEARETTYSVQTETMAHDDILRMALPKQSMSPSTSSSADTHSVIIDFLGIEGDARRGIDAKDFHGDVEVGNIFYRDEDTLTYVHLHGTFLGEFTVPSTYADKVTRFKTILASKDRIKGANLEGHYLLSYQGNLYTKNDLSDKASFLIYPNRQVQTVGKTGDVPLNLLIPHGEKENTEWRLFTTIPAKTNFVQIDINRLITTHNAAYTVKLSNNAKGLNAGDIGASPEDHTGVLGTLYFAGETLVEGGTMVITVQ
ncbi:hypothetical protein [Desulfoluna sp.]|uniref:hypothetical protein n=1 Tax=Desulfoluna sp. TaxID=2045199 RepID=UPI0026140349|nr:hypothetical protein [Desulfoluna sp.]